MVTVIIMGMVTIMGATMVKGMATMGIIIPRVLATGRITTMVITTAIMMALAMAMTMGKVSKVSDHKSMGKVVGNNRQI